MSDELKPLRDQFVVPRAPEVFETKRSIQSQSPAAAEHERQLELEKQRHERKMELVRTGIAMAVLAVVGGVYFFADLAPDRIRDLGLGVLMGSAATYLFKK